MTAPSLRPIASSYRLAAPPPWVDTVSAALRALNAPVVVAFSGGVDSSALLLCVAHAGIPAVAVHIQHHLRSDAHRDAAQATATARHVGIPCQVLHLDGAALRAGGNVADASRDARYEALHGIASPLAAVLLTAHHVEDLLETFILRLDQGAGLAGAFGLRESTVLHGTPVFRPLLTCWKHELRALVTDAEIGWADDTSNASRDYQRNRLRPALATLIHELRSPSRFAESLRGAAREAWALHTADDATLLAAPPSSPSSAAHETTSMSRSEGASEGQESVVRLPYTTLFEGEPTDSKVATRILRAIDRRTGARPRRATLEQVVAAARAKKTLRFHDQRLEYRCDSSGVTLTMGVSPRLLALRHSVAATDAWAVALNVDVLTPVAPPCARSPLKDASPPAVTGHLLYTQTPLIAVQAWVPPLPVRVRRRRPDDVIVSLRSGRRSGLGKRLARDGVPPVQRDEVWVVELPRAALARIMDDVPHDDARLGANVIIGYLCNDRRCVTVPCVDQVAHQIRWFPA